MVFALWCNGNINLAAVPVVTVPQHELLFFEPVDDTHHRAGAQIVLPGHGAAGERAALLDRQKTGELRACYVVRIRQLVGVDVDGPYDPA